MLLHRTHRWSALKSWDVRLMKRVGAKKAKVAVCPQVRHPPPEHTHGAQTSERTLTPAWRGHRHGRDPTENEELSTGATKCSSNKCNSIDEIGVDSSPRLKGRLTCHLAQAATFTADDLPCWYRLLSISLDLAPEPVE